MLDSGRFILGPEVAAPSGCLEPVCGRPCVGVANGTDALVIGLAVGVGPGDEVITTPYTFYATAEAIARLGRSRCSSTSTPLTATIDPDAIEDAVTERTKAIIPRRHLRPPGRHDAHPHGGCREQPLRHRTRPSRSAPPTTSGRSAPSATSSPSASSRPRTSPASATAEWSWRATRRSPIVSAGSASTAQDKVTFEEVGYNSRLDELQATVIRIFLPHLDRWNDGRATPPTATGRPGSVSS